MAIPLRTALALVLGSTVLPQWLAAAEPELECTTSGYDVLLTNTGPVALPPGTRIAWDVRFVRRSGEFVLEKAIEPKENLFVSGALGSDYLSSPQPCAATVEEN